MATDDDKPDDAAARDEEERRKRALALSQEIAQRWEPSRLSKLVVGGAGAGEKLDLATQSEMEKRLGHCLLLLLQAEMAQPAAGVSRQRRK